MLTLLKESYFLVANAYGFLVHPYLTLKHISRDRSQMAIFGSLWVGGGLGILLLLLVVELLVPRIFPGWMEIKSFGRLIFAFGLFVFSAFTFYLLYWLNTFLKKRND